MQSEETKFIEQGVEFVGIKFLGNDAISKNFMGRIR